MGLDPIALIVRKYYGLQMGSINSAINCAILVAAIGVVGLEAVAVTLISVYVYTIITNKVVIGFNQRKVMIGYRSLQKHVHRRTYHDKTVTTNTLRCV